MGKRENGSEEKDSIPKSPLRIAAEIAVLLTIALVLLSLLTSVGPFLASYINNLSAPTINSPTITTTINPTDTAITTLTATPTIESRITPAAKPTDTPIITSTATPAISPIPTLRAGPTSITAITPTTPTLETFITPSASFRVGPWHDNSSVCSDEPTDEWVRIKGVEISGGIPPYEISFWQFGREIDSRTITPASRQVEFVDPVVVNKGAYVHVTISFQTANGKTQWSDDLFYYLADLKCSLH